MNGANIIWEGHSINSQYLLRADRIIQTDADLALVQQMIDNAPIDEKTGKKVNPFAAFGTHQKEIYCTKTSMETVLSTWMTAKSSATARIRNSNSV